MSRGASLSQHPHSSAHHIATSNANSVQSHPIVAYPRHPVKLSCHSSGQAQPRRSSPETRASLPLGKDPKAISELQGVVLTLASPGSDRGRL